MANISRIIKNRPIAILLHGNSIRQLEERIVEFKELDFCYCSLNRFDIVESNILQKVNKTLDIVYCSNYKEVDIIKDNLTLYLQRNDNNLFITSLDAFIDREDFINNYLNKVLFSKQIKFTGGIYVNSLTILLHFLIGNGVRKIILFGCDGLEDGKMSDVGIMRSSYYKVDTIDEKSRDWNVIDDTEKFNTYFTDSLYRLHDKQIIDNLDIVNCNLNTFIQSFNKIEYSHISQWYNSNNINRPISTVEFLQKKFLLELNNIDITTANKLIKKYKILDEDWMENVAINKGLEWWWRKTK